MDTPEPHLREIAKPVSKAACPVVGVGASAGGLEAFQQLLAEAKPGLRLAYVLVQHLDPTHESMLSELLGRRTRLTVKVIEDGMTVEPENVYLIPPGSELRISESTLRLVPFSQPRGQRRPIDVFFESLAADQGPNAACIVLSGTGADGSLGLRAVKVAGGLTLVQEPGEAKYDGMPNAAVATGLVDLILPPSRMPAILHNYFTTEADLLRTDDNAQENFLNQVFETVRHRTGHDFSRYKTGTLVRRVARRMQVVGLEDRSEYLRKLIGEPGEANFLLRDLLINVTSFMRDPEAFDALRLQVIPRIIANRGKDETIRIWVPGCSSGEEAYSLAMLFADAIERTESAAEVQIFATDIDEQMLQLARRGHYPHASVSELPPELVDRYLFAEGDGYSITQTIRDMVRISAHNLIKDPPFSRIDLISCRNLLIYFDNELQRRIMPVFHYSLRKDGFLFLGPSENRAGHDELFVAIDNKFRLFSRANVKVSRSILPLDTDRNRKELTIRSQRPVEPREVSEVDLAMRISERYAPPHVLVNARNEIVHSSPRTGLFLEFSQGKPNNEIFDLAKPEIRPALRSLISEVQMKRTRKVKKDVTFEFDNEAYQIDLSAEPYGNNLTLVVFQNRVAAEIAGDREVEPDTDIDDDASQSARIAELEDELSAARVSLRTTVEELETSNEELKSSNEEMMSMNEELQSSNEELTTINDELTEKLDQLAVANADIKNFVESARIPLIFLDGDLNVRNFTPEATRLFKFVEQDRGRSITDINAVIDSEVYESMARDVLDTLEPREQTIFVEELEEHFILRVLPYRTMNERIDGVVISMIDVTDVTAASAELKEKQLQLERQVEEIAQLYDSVPLGMGLIDSDNQYVRINATLASINGVHANAHLGRTVREIVPDLADDVEATIARVLETGDTISGETITGRTTGTLGQRIFETDWFPYDFESSDRAVGVIVRDVTDQREMASELKRVMSELQHRVKNMLATVMALMNHARGSKGDPADVLAALSDRIEALTKTHSLLTKTDWLSADFKDLIASELTSVFGVDRITVRGPNVLLNAKAALNLSMAIHELATNASKYGALSNADGNISINWSVSDFGDGERFILNWEEKSGPKIAESAGTGFGSKLITSTIGRTLDGTIDTQWSDDGIAYTFEIPMAKLAVRDRNDGTYELPDTAFGG